MERGGREGHGGTGRDKEGAGRGGEVDRDGLGVVEWWICEMGVAQ